MRNCRKLCIVFLPLSCFVLVCDKMWKSSGVIGPLHLAQRYVSVCMGTCSTCVFLCGCVYLRRAPSPRSGPAVCGGGEGSRLGAPICCSWPQGRRARRREMMGLLGGTCCPRRLAEHDSWCHKPKQSSGHNSILSIFLIEYPVDPRLFRSICRG